MNAVWTDNDTQAEDLSPQGRVASQLVRLKSDLQAFAAATASAPAAREPKIERETHKLEKRLCRQVGQAIMDFNMIEEGDRVMVCVSGGKDSYGLLDILLKMQKRGRRSTLKSLPSTWTRSSPAFRPTSCPSTWPSSASSFTLKPRTPTASSKR